jgi:hypothetical protein
MPFKAAAVNFLKSSKAIDFLPRAAFGDYTAHGLRHSL